VEERFGRDAFVTAHEAVYARLAAAGPARRDHA